MRLFLTSPGHFYDSGSSVKSQLTLGTALDLSVSYQDVRLLQRRSKDKGLSCGYEHVDDCITRVLRERQMQEFGCTVPWTKNNTE